MGLSGSELKPRTWLLYFSDLINFLHDCGYRSEGSANTTSDAEIPLTRTILGNVKIASARSLVIRIRIRRREEKKVTTSVGFDRRN